MLIVKDLKKESQRLRALKQTRDSIVEAVSQCIPTGDFSGDYHKVIQFRPGHYGFIIADANGSGPESMQYAASLGRTLEEKLRKNKTPDQALHEVSREFACHPNAQRFASLLYAQLAVDGDNGFALIYSAGHDMPFVYSPGKGITQTSGMPPDPVIGPSFLLKSNAYHFQPIGLRLDKEDLLIMHTDGLTEAANKQGLQLGQEGISHILCNATNRSLKGIVRYTLQAIEAYRQESPHSKDDLTMITARVN